MGNDADGSLQRQVNDLNSQVATNRGDIQALTARANAADDRADAADERAETADRRADAADLRADLSDLRAQADREMVAELVADGQLSREHVGELEQALVSSRTIGAAIGMVMASRLVSQDEAFVILKQASQRSNKKIRDLAAEMVQHGKLSALEQL